MLAKKEFSIIFLCIFLLLVGCSNNNTKTTTEKKVIANETLINQVIQECNEILENTNKTLCLAEKAIENIQQGSNIIEEICSRSPSSDICFYYSAFLLEDKNYCDFVKEDVIGCKLTSTTSYCMNYENAQDMCYEAQLDLIMTYDIELAKKRCKIMGSVNSKVRKMCKEKDWTDEFTDMTKKERFMLMYQISKLSQFSEETVVLKK